MNLGNLFLEFNVNNPFGYLNVKNTEVDTQFKFSIQLRVEGVSVR